MPTGYTYLIQKGINFEGFVLACARAFGACVTMRDDPCDKPIPKEFKPSDYHPNRIKEYEKRLKELKKTTLTQAIKEADKQHKKELKEMEESLKKSVKIRQQYTNMLIKVRAWNPPTKDHEGLKKFMVHQIEDSIRFVRFDCMEDYYKDKEIQKLSGEEWLSQEIQKTLRNISYHKKEWEEEKARVAGSNQWLKELRKSLEEE